MNAYDREGRSFGILVSIPDISQEDVNKAVTLESINEEASWKFTDSVVYSETQHYAQYNTIWAAGKLTENGGISNHGAYRTTCFIPLYSGDAVFYHIGTNTSDVLAVSYDKDKNVVGYVRPTETHRYDYAEGYLDIPSSARYCRVSMWLDNMDGVSHRDQYIVHYVNTVGAGKDAGKSEMPENGLENFSVTINCCDYTTNADDSIKEYVDYGVIKLPENYSKSGKPTRMIILCGGTGERINAETNPSSFHGWSYFVSKGYAVMDMNGMPSEWGEEEGFPSTNQHYCNKYLLNSYLKGYEYVINKYNIDPNVFVVGISTGGGASALIVQTGIIPVIAHCCFCPALSVYKQDYMKPWNSGQQKTIAGQWGFDNWETATTFNQNYFMQNLDKITGFDNLLINTIGDHDTANANYNNEAEETAYNGMSKIYPVPLKIWHCTDDSIVLVRYSQFMVNMIKNAGGQAWLRTFETGGHSGGWSYGSVSDVGLYGKALTVSIPFYEAWLFFTRFE